MEEENKNEELQNEQEENETEKSEETKLKDTILLQKEQLEEQEDRLKRLMAEFENFKKRSGKDFPKAKSQLNCDFAVNVQNAFLLSQFDKFKFRTGFRCKHESCRYGC